MIDLLPIPSGAPAEVDRVTAADMLTRAGRPTAPRTLEGWPVAPVGRANGRKTFRTAEIFAEARRRVLRDLRKGTA
jgi:hypothetical protein